MLTIPNYYQGMFEYTIKWQGNKYSASQIKRYKTWFLNILFEKCMLHREGKRDMHFVCMMSETWNYDIRMHLDARV